MFWWVFDALEIAVIDVVPHIHMHTRFCVTIQPQSQTVYSSIDFKCECDIPYVGRSITDVYNLR